MPLTPQQIQERFLKLPPELRDAIFSEDITSVIMAIGKKYGLAIDKIGELHSETNQVILGVTHPKGFIASLEKRLQVDQETAKKIAHEVNQQIFARIRESLKKLHNIEGEESSAASTVKPTIPSEKSKIPFSQLKQVSSEPSSTPSETPKDEETVSAQPSSPAETSSPPEPVKSIFEEKMKDEVFRQESEETEAEVSIPVDTSAGDAEAELQKEAEEIMPDVEKQVEKAKTGDYPGNVDPYREQPTEHETKPKERAA